MKQTPQSPDLTTLTLDQKKALLEALRKKQLIKKESVLKDFKRNSVQEKFHSSSKKIRALIGGNAVGKTTALVLEILETHLRTHKFRDVSRIHHTWCIVPSYDKVEDYWVKIKMLCPPSKLPEIEKMGTSHIRRLRWQNGDTTTFFSHEQSSEKFEGTNLDAIFIDEPCPRDQYVAAYRGLRSNPSHFIVFALTPLSEPWIYTDIYLPWSLKKDPNIEVFQGTIWDNEKNLAPGFIEDFKGRLTEEEVRTRLYGEFKVLQGRVFKEFSRHTHVFKHQPWPETWPVYFALDPHPRKPHFCLWMGVTPDDEFVVLDELSFEGDIEGLASAILSKERANKYLIAQRRMDNSGSASDWNRDTMVNGLRALGVRISPMRKWEKEVEPGIQKIKRALRVDREGGPQLRFLDNCHLTIRDMEMYSWLDHRHPEVAGIKESPRKIYDEAPDLLRYLLMSNPVHSLSIQYLSLLEDDVLPYTTGKKKEAFEIDSEGRKWRG